MGKRLNTTLLLLGMSIISFIIFFIVMAIGGIIIIYLIPAKSLPPLLIQALWVFVFFGAIIGSSYLYSLIMKILDKKFDMKKYFLPIYKPGHNPNRDDE